MRKRYSDRRGIWRRTALAGAVAACFAGNTALANPTGPAVTQGQASFATQGNTLTVTNAPGTVINWQGFSIAGSEITRFIQQSQMSAVLNRVVGVNPSAILGALQSNGRVYLVNPNGITIGPGANIDVAGFLASTLNLSDGDFLSGRMRFTESPGAAAVVNEGTITTATGGMVYLVGRDVQNSGIIRSPQGEILLAAGSSIELVDAQTPEVRVELTAPDNQVLNVGQLIAAGGRIGMYGTLVGHSGVASANTAVMGENGKIVFKAVKDVKLEAGSVTTASGPTAGSITAEARTGSVTVAGTVEANATAGRGGSIDISGQQGVMVETTGRISANGIEGGSITLRSSSGPVEVSGQVNAAASAGRGGQVAIAAATQAAVRAGGRIGASGTQDGGFVSVKAGESVTLETGSSIATNGASGGIVEISADSGSVEAGGLIDASGLESAGGSITITARVDVMLGDTSALLARGSRGGTVYIEAREGTTLASGLIDAFGRDGPGGEVLLLGPRVGLIRNARINVSGRSGGGVALVGGDFQGSNPEIPNAQRTYVGADVLITADAIESGDGGKVIIWADGDTRFHGLITARGGSQSGNGGFVEVSGKEILNFYGSVDVGAPAGRAGTILLDPRDIIVIVDTNPGANDVQVADSAILFADGTATTDYTISDEALELLTGNIVLQATRDITISSSLSGGGLVLTNQTTGERVVLQAGRHIVINSPLITNGAAIWLEADSPHVNGYTGLTGTSGADGTGAVRINRATSCAPSPAACTMVQSFVSDPATGGTITLLAGSGSNQGQSGGGFTLNADVNAGAGGIDVALTTEGTGELQFLIGAGGKAQFTSADTGALLSTGRLKIGEATTAGTDGLRTNEITIKVDQLSIGSTAGGPVTLADTAGTSLVLTAGDGGILVDKPLSTNQDTFIDTTGPLTISASAFLTTNGQPLNINAASIGGAGNITNSNLVSCLGTGCPDAIGVITWDGGGDGSDWFDELNWSGNFVPTTSHDVVILSSAGPIVISGGGASVKSLIAEVPLTITSTGSLSLAQASQLTQDFSLSGSLLGTGVVAVSGNSGVLSWTGGTMGSGGTFTLGVGASGTLSGTLTLDRFFHNSSALTLDGVINISGTGSIENSGILTAASGTTNNINVGLTNPSNALISVLGTLTVGTPVTPQFSVNDGVISVGSGGTFSTNGHLLTNSATSSIIVNGGKFSTTVGNTVETVGGNLALTGALSAGKVVLSASGNVTLNAGSSITALSSDDTIVISGDGFINDAGASALDPGAGRWLVYSSSPAGNTFGPIGDLLASGNQAVWNATFSGNAPATIAGGNRYVFSTQPTLTYLANTAARDYGDSNPTFTGSVSGFVDASLYGSVFTQDTLANATTGTISFTSPATPSSNVGSYAINGGGLTANNGNYVFAQDAANATAFTITPALVSLAGTRTYDATTSFAAGTFGTINGVNGETLTLSGSGTVASPKVLAGTQALATGTLALGNGTNGVASNYTLAGGAHTGTITASLTFPFVWDLGSAVDLDWGNPANWNQGAVPLNGAAASIPSGLAGPVVYSSASGATGLTTLSSGSGFTITGGTLTLGNSTADVSTFSGRPLTLNGGTLDGTGTISLAGTTLDVLAGGVLGGSRTIIGNVNNLAGTVSPGASPGTMTIDGNYLQGPSGTLLAEIGGLAAGAQYDRLIVSGTVTLDGNLNVALGNGFIPATGNTFTIVESGGGVSGTFATTSLPSASPMQVDLLASSVNVTTGTLAPVDTAQLISFQINQIDASLPTETDMSKFIVVTDPITNETFVTVGAVEIAVSGDAKERAQKPGVCR